MMYARGMMGQYGNYGPGCYFGGIHILFGIALLIAAILVVVYFVKKSKKNNSVEAVSDSALDVLKLRLVQGEISEEEYMKKKELLSKK